MTSDRYNQAPRIVCFGEILLRLAAPSTQLLFQEPVLEPTFCGAEANVAANLAGLGHRARMVSALPDNPVGEAAARAIAGFRVALAAPRVASSRLGTYYLQPGAMTRSPRVTYDRAGSAFAQIDPGSYDWPTLLAGAEWLFVGGITAALGDKALAALREAIAQAQTMGLKIAFDTNYRPALWQGREDQAAGILRDLSLEADLIFAGRRATAMMVGGSYDHADPDEGFHAAAQAMFAASARLQHMAATQRVVHSSDRQDLTGLVADRSGSSASARVALENIVDRVGTGDAFAAGVMHALLTGMSRDDTATFATACAEWAHSVRGDIMLATLADVEAIASGSRDVRR